MNNKNVPSVGGTFFISTTIFLLRATVLWASSLHRTLVFSVHWSAADSQRSPPIVNDCLHDVLHPVQYVPRNADKYEFLILLFF